MSKVAKYKGQNGANFIHLSLGGWLPLLGPRVPAPAPAGRSVSGELSDSGGSGYGECCAGVSPEPVSRPTASVHTPHP